MLKRVQNILTFITTFSARLSASKKMMVMESNSSHFVKIPDKCKNKM